MAKPITIPNTFASATSAIPLSQLDQDFSTLANATNDLATYSNYVADTGAADAYIANFPANTNTASLTAGLTVQFKAANANTGASTLNVQVNGSSIGTAAIRYANGSALAAGAIAAGAMVSVMYDGTNFQLINDPAGQSGGDVTGPASATDNAIARFDGATGKLIQNSVVTIADTTGDMAGVGNISATNVTVTSLNNSGNLAFTGTGNRITGDFSNATIANRVLFQSSTTNGNTNIQIIPNGTSVVSTLNVSNGTDPDNSALGQLRINSTVVGLDSTITGTGTYLPLTMRTGGSERLRIDTSGNLLLGTTTSFTSTNIAGALKMDGYGIYPYLNSSGATNTSVVGGLVYQNSTPYAGDNGATGSTIVAALVQPRLSNSGVGGANTIAIQGGNFGPVITDTGATARISSIGIFGATTRNISTDLSTNANNQITGVSGSITHGTTAGAGIVSATGIAGNFTATNQNGTITNIEGVRGSVAVANTTASLSSSSTNASGFRSVMTVGAASGGPGTVTNLYGFLTQGPTIGATGTVSNYFGVYIDTATVTGTLTNRWGIYQADTTGANYFGANVGIGTSSPTAPLTVVTPSGGLALQINGRSSDNLGGLYFYANNGTTSYSQITASATEYRVASQSTAVQTFYTNGSERMRIDSSGNVGIGTSTINTVYATTLGIGGSGSTASLQFRSTVTGTATTDGLDVGLLDSGTGDGYLWLRENAKLYLGTNGTERIVIDGSGLVGIGTSSPSSFNAAADNLVVGTTSGNNGITIAGGTAGFSSIYMADGTTGNEAYRGYIEYRHSDDAMAFGTAASERMRITSGGDLCIGTTSTTVTGARLTLRGTQSWAVGPQASDSTFYVYNESSQGVYILNGGTSWTSSSDERKKDIIEPITDATNKVSQLRAVIGKFKNDEEGTRRSFLIAQDVQKVLPEAVNELNDEDKTLGVQYTDVIPLLVAAIKELKAELDATKAEVALLKSK